MSYLYIGVVILFVIILLVVAKMEDGEDMEHKEDE